MLSDIHSEPDNANEGTLEINPEIIDAFYRLISGYLVFFMQCGFCMLAAGSVRKKNANIIILKNFLDGCIGALGWYFFGYAFAYGTDSNTIGHHYFALHDIRPTDLPQFFFQYAFAAAAATIVSGAVAERTRFGAYLLYSFFVTAWVYPIVVHWVWNDSGWLSARKPENKFLESGMIDFAGCSVVHMVGGFSGLAGAAIVGARLGRFGADGRPRQILGHSIPLAMLGVFILWFGWYGFNPGSTGGISTMDQAEIAANCAISTTLAAASGTISTFILLILVRVNEDTNQHTYYDVLGMGNGALAGLVSITAGCAVVKPWASIIIGIIAGIIYVIGSYVLCHNFKIDDPLNVVSVHGFCGIWGLLSVGLFANKQLIEKTYEGYYDHSSSNTYGCLLGGNGRLLASAIIGIIVILTWVLVNMVTFFYILNKTGNLRISRVEEHSGLDIVTVGHTAYPEYGQNDKEEVENANLTLINELREEIVGLKSKVRTIEGVTTDMT